MDVFEALHGSAVFKRGETQVGWEQHEGRWGGRGKEKIDGEKAWKRVKGKGEQRAKGGGRNGGRS